MFVQSIKKWNINFRIFLFTCLLLFPLTLHASFIESTIGTAVVNDATATYYNPAALTLLKNPQIIGLGSLAYFHTQFTGQTVQSTTGFTQSGTSTSQTLYYLPSIYFATPISNKISVGMNVISNDFNRDIQDNSILRYAQSNNHIQDIDLVSSIGIKVTDFFSLGAGLTFSHANFLLQPITGFPTLNIPDSQSRNEVSDTSWGEDFGLLLKPTQSTLLGFNYRSRIEYRMTGTSVFEGIPQITSNNYHFKFWTPGRSVISVNQFVTQNLGVIGTLQRVEWSVFKNINIFNIATQRGILPEATVPFHLHDTWLLTLGTNYRINPKWIVRFAATYDQSPGNSRFQISNGDSIILGGSMGYEINKNVIIDGSYAHAFIESQNINITTGRNFVNGVNRAYRDAVSIKLTLNIC